MAASFERVKGLAFTPNFGLCNAEWDIKGVNLQNEDTEMTAFAVARVMNGERTYPRLLRLGVFTDSSMVKDYVWRQPRGNVLTYALPKEIGDFSNFFRGEPQPWQGYIEDEGATAIRGMYRSIVEGGAVTMEGQAFLPIARLAASDLGTPPTYVH